MENPRFPHCLQVIRVSEDEYGQPIYDEGGNPVYEVLPLDVVKTLDGEPQRRYGELVTVKSNGISFGYRTSTQNTSTAGDVIVSDFKIATPMFTTPLRSGDILELTDYERTFRGYVVKKMTFNWGSNIWFNEVKN